MKLAIVAGFTAAALLGTATVLDTQDLLQGTWQFVSLQDGGRTAPSEVLEDAQWLITGDKIVQKGGGQTLELSYTLDPSQSPKWIDLKAEGRTMLGIYEIEADTLKVCFSESRDAGRSTAFESLSESVNDVLIVLVRESL